MNPGSPCLKAEPLTTYKSFVALTESHNELKCLCIVWKWFIKRKKCLNFSFFSKKNLFTVLAQTISATSFKICLYKLLIQIFVNIDVRVSMLQEEM